MWIIIPTLQIVKISIAIVIIPPISQRIYISNTILISYNSIITPCIIGVFRNASAIAVKYSNYVALKICYIIVLFAVKFKAYRCISVIAEVPFVIISVCLCRQLVAVPVVIKVCNTIPN